MSQKKSNYLLSKEIGFLTEKEGVRKNDTVRNDLTIP